MSEEKNIFNTDLNYCDCCKYLDVAEGEQTKEKERKKAREEGKMDALREGLVVETTQKQIRDAKIEAIEQFRKEAMKQTGYTYGGTDSAGGYNRAMTKIRKFLREYK